VYLTPPIKEFPLVFGTGARDQKTRMMELPGRERSMAISSAVWIQYTNGTEGRTDRQTPADSKDRAYAQRRAVIIFCHIQLMLLFTSSAVTETAWCTCAIYTPSPCVIMLNLVVLGQTLRELVGSPKKLQCWGPSLGLGVAMPNFIAVGQMVRSYVWRSARKLGPSLSAFQGHSRSSELTRIGRPPMTC